MPFATSDELRLSDEYKGKVLNRTIEQKTIKIDFMPAADIYEDDDAYYFEIELPGSSIENTLVRITEDNIMVVEGRKIHSSVGQARRVFVKEREAGNFSRAFELPEDIDSFAIEANYYDGILFLTVPKKRQQKEYNIAIN